MLILLSVFEGAARWYDAKEAEEFLSVQDNAESFGSFPSMLQYGKRLGYIQERLTGTSMGGGAYEPYQVVSLKPNYRFQFKNVEYIHNSLGFRGEDIVVPKRPGTFRVVIIGGSSVQGGYNERWTISYYLANKLKATHENVEVINAGVVGAMSQNELAILQIKVIDLKPDLAIIFDGRNDLYYSVTPNWQNRQGDPYFGHKKALDALINEPSLFTLSTNLARYIAKQSSLVTRIFRLLARRGIDPVYPKKVQFNSRAIDTYLDNLKLIKATLEVEGIRGLIAFQPTLGYCKNNLTQYEQSITDYLIKNEESDWFERVNEAWPKMGERVSSLPASRQVRFVNLACIFRDVEETAYIDSVHYTPKGAEVIASVISDQVKSFYAETMREHGAMAR